MLKRCPFNILQVTAACHSRMPAGYLRSQGSMVSLAPFTLHQYPVGFCLRWYDDVAIAPNKCARPMIRSIIKHATSQASAPVSMNGIGHKTGLQLLGSCCVVLVCFAAYVLQPTYIATFIASTSRILVITATYVAPALWVVNINMLRQKAVRGSKECDVQLLEGGEGIQHSTSAGKESPDETRESGIAQPSEEMMTPLPCPASGKQLHHCLGPVSAEQTRSLAAEAASPGAIASAADVQVLFQPSSPLYVCTSSRNLSKRSPSSSFRALAGAGGGSSPAPLPSILDSPLARRVTEERDQSGFPTSPGLSELLLRRNSMDSVMQYAEQQQQQDAPWATLQLRSISQQLPDRSSDTHSSRSSFAFSSSSSTSSSGLWPLLVARRHSADDADRNATSKRPGNPSSGSELHSSKPGPSQTCAIRSCPAEGMKHTPMFSYEQLLALQGAAAAAAGITDLAGKERFLRPEEFPAVFGTSCPEFAALRPWKQAHLKRIMGLF